MWLKKVIGGWNAQDNEGKIVIVVCVALVFFMVVGCVVAYRQQSAMANFDYSIPKQFVIIEKRVDNPVDLGGYVRYYFYFENTTIKLEVSKHVFDCYDIGAEVTKDFVLEYTIYGVH